ncbi:MAG TPA: sigma 54-interacting transcriptional regulator [Kofleriaceae bacterium]|nr:sigma 54-interacting transcriptional regulator [Kofleriaceae bacterium]
MRAAYGAITGQSSAMQTLYSLLERIALSESTVLIQGENGTGKELVARAIHADSARNDRPFVVQNCSALNDNLLDSELFGHRKGAFTGAVSDRRGLFEAAHEGTLFLDEIGDMSPALQVKVLRVIQEGTFIPVGDTSSRRVDVRLIAATNRDLKAMVASGEFREDLFYRIHVINLAIPPLRDREGDLELLVDRFLASHARGRAAKKLSDGCMALLCGYFWPGNVRELENEIERLVVLAGTSRIIDESLLSPRIRDAANRREGNPRSLTWAVENLEREMIAAALERHRGNKTQAARELEVSRRNLIRLVHKYNLDRPRQ